MIPDAILSGIASTSWRPAPGHSDLHLIETEGEGEMAVAWEGLRLPGLVRFLALVRYLPWWLRPAWGDCEAEVPREECQLLLWRREDGRWGVLLPTAHGNRRAWVTGGDTGLALRTRGAAHPDEPARLCLAVAGVGDDPAALVADAVAAAMERLRTARPRTVKPTPPWVDSFGWCTWDAFYHDVTAAKIEEGLVGFAKDGIAVPLLIVDDGWQQWQDGQLMSFAADPAKFPGGLAALVDAVTARHGVRMVGVWHALVGYWNGVHPKGELARRYRLCPSCQGSYNFPGGKSLERSLVHPDDIHRFYHDFHAGLAAQGVAMVKVDNQSSLDHFTDTLLPDYLTMATYQRAVQGAAAVHLGNNLLHCMAMSNDAVWNLASSAVLRNSDDYFPKKPESHGVHLCANAANALWSASFVIPDWDMFHSGHEAGWFHGAARAISGGPVYVSDVPGKHDPTLIRALTLSGGRVARPQPARVADSRILVDCTREDRLLLIRSQAVAGHLLGAFHCRHGEGVDAISDDWSPADAGAVGQVAVRGFRAAVTEVMDAAAVRRLRLDRLGWEVFAVAPFTNGVAVLGLEGKLAGLAAVTRWEALGDGMFHAEVADGGILRLVSDRNLAVRFADGRALSVQRDAGGDWLVEVPANAPIRLVVVAT
jgi:raffinose synthase